MNFAVSWMHCTAPAPIVIAMVMVKYKNKYILLKIVADGNRPRFIPSDVVIRQCTVSSKLELLGDSDRTRHSHHHKNDRITVDGCLLTEQKNYHWID